ncbi:MAG TPA: MBL fold metallo-hydrolase [Gemmatimonadaceae bacterium]|nr:MBL fold metallo-hydrolase [Gemmatimonadaceae bacterium]
MKIEWVTVGPFQENSYLLANDAGGHGVLVDPGDEPDRILRMVRAADVTIDAVWLTHGHLDHIGAVAALKREWNVPVLMHPDDLVLYRRAAQQAAFYGLPFEQPEDPDGTLADGEQLVLGDDRFTVRHTPGHSPGHVILVGAELIVGGDLLFAGSIGRTDLPFSSPEAMDTSLGLVAAMPPELAVYPGHGPPTTVGAELATNPYLAGVHHVR